MERDGHGTSNEGHQNLIVNHPATLTAEIGRSCMSLDTAL